MRLRSFRRGGHNGVMHVISGRFKGVALTTPKTGTRPTTDRTKEAIFSHLDSWQGLDDARVLDLFAGTGALGIEALSRGARELVAVESSAPAAALIAKTLTALQRNRSWERGMTARVIRARAEKYVASGAARSASNADAAGGSAKSAAFDVIFIDRRTRSPPRTATSCSRTWSPMESPAGIRRSCWSDPRVPTSPCRPRDGSSPSIAITARPRCGISSPRLRRRRPRRPRARRMSEQPRRV